MVSGTGQHTPISSCFSSFFSGAFSSPLPLLVGVLVLLLPALLFGRLGVVAGLLRRLSGRFSLLESNE